MTAWSRAEANRYRFDGASEGHYESFFLRGNHPTAPRAFWVRYTMYRGRGRDGGDAARAELWFIHFDGETGENCAAKFEGPLADSHFGLRGSALDLRVGSATLTDDLATGTIETPRGGVSWDLRLSSDASRDAPLLLLDERLYDAPFPKAKSVVSRPFTTFSGTLIVEGTAVAVDGWTGSQNHNWGSRHTDRYAWGQVVGFDGAPDVFLECATARLRVGPLWTPPLTTLVLVEGSRRTTLTRPQDLARAAGSVSDLAWTVRAKGHGAIVEATFEAPSKSFVGLTYDNPPGGAKVCLNSKLARCVLTVHRDGKSRRLESQRAAFELLQDDAHPRIAVRV